MESRSESQSVTTSNEHAEEPISELDDDHLYQKLKDTLRENEHLALETAMFEKFLKTIDPKDILSTKNVPFPQHQTPGSSQSSSVQDLRPGQANRKRTRSKGSYVDKVYRLTTDQKCEVATKEIEDMKRELGRLNQESERHIDSFKAQVEECEACVGDIEKIERDFERDVIIGAVNPRTNKILGEKVLRFMEERVRGKDGMVEKLRLKNATLRFQKKKLDVQLKQKEEMGEVLHKVDFDQLKIENQQYLEKIEEKNQDLLRLKVMASNTLQILANYKKKLQATTLESNRAASEFSSRNELLVRIDQEWDTVEEEKAKADAINRRLKSRMSNFRVPEVMAYVSEKQHQLDLQAKVKTWERKIEIAEMALKTSKKTWRLLLETGQQQNHAISGTHGVQLVA